MNVRQMVMPLPEGGEATLAFPEAMSGETIEVLEQASALVFRALRRAAHGHGAGSDDREHVTAGAAEYESWAAGAAEYDSWTWSTH